MNYFFAMTKLNSIGFQVVSSPDTNDHEVKIFVDGEDFIARRWPGMMGMDPDDILSYDELSARNEPHETTIIRCGCGVVGCCSTAVRISVEDDRVIWDSWAGNTGNPPAETLVFDRNQYARAIKNAIENYSWETPDRTAARILSSIVDHGALDAKNLKYQWASGRIQESTFTVSLRGPEGCHQILVHLTWNEQAPDEIAREAAHLLKTNPNDWPDIVWYGEKSNPPFTGPAWRKRY